MLGHLVWKFSVDFTWNANHFWIQLAKLLSMCEKNCQISHAFMMFRIKDFDCKSNVKMELNNKEPNNGSLDKLNHILLHHFRPSQHGWTHICARPELKSRTSKRISAMASNLCSSWRSFPEKPCKSPTVARWGSTKSPMSTRLWTSSPAKASNLSLSVLKVKIKIFNDFWIEEENNDDYVGGEYEIENNALKSIIFCSASKVIKVQFQGRIGACFQNPAISQCFQKSSKLSHFLKNFPKNHTF